MKMIIWLLYGTVVVYSMLDGVQTKMLIDLGAKEINPIMDWAIIASGTVYSIFFIKGAVLLFLLVLLAIYFKDVQRIPKGVKA